MWELLLEVFVELLRMFLQDFVKVVTDKGDGIWRGWRLADKFHLKGIDGFRRTLRSHRDLCDPQISFHFLCLGAHSRVVEALGASQLDRRHIRTKAKSAGDWLGEHILTSAVASQMSRLSDPTGLGGMEVYLESSQLVCKTLKRASK